MTINPDNYSDDDGYWLLRELAYIHADLTNSNNSLTDLSDDEWSIKQTETITQTKHHIQQATQLIATLIHSIEGDN